MTGHADGVITINLAEADDAERERRRQQMGELIARCSVISVTRSAIITGTGWSQTTPHLEEFSPHLRR